MTSTDASSAQTTPGSGPIPGTTSGTNPALALIGLGKMGANMARRLSRRGVTVQGYDPSPPDELAAEGIRVHESLAAAIAALPGGTPRIVWLMLPHGPVTDEVVAQVTPLLSAGDILIDGGNANYLESQARAQVLAKAGLVFMDCGVSGGIWGLKTGYCLMFGGDAATMRHVQPLAEALAPAPDKGWLLCGPAGAGHFTKMIHNGIEYGMMQSLAEGFALLEGKSEFRLDLAAISELWRSGSVVRSWLLDLTADLLRTPDAIKTVAPIVADSGEGRWTIDEAIRQGTPTPVIALALMSRFDSQGKADVGNKLLALMRKGFGGHATGLAP